MISKIFLVNFQRHKNITVDLSKGLNAIVGGNDKGKSSIIRAIYWCFYNSPPGDWMCRIDPNGALTRTQVKIMFIDNTVLYRIREKKKNIYIFKGERFTNFGNEVPIPICEYLKNISIKLPSFTQSLSIHMQDDKPFMVFESKNIKGNLVNHLTGLGTVDSIKKSINNTANDIRSNIRVYDNLIDESKKKLQSFPNIICLEESKNRIQTKYNQYLDCIDQYNSIVKLLNFSSSVDSIIARHKSEISRLTKKIKQCDVIEKLKKQLKFLVDKKTGLLYQMKIVDEVKQSVIHQNNRLKNVISEYHSLDGQHCTKCGKPLKINQESYTQFIYDEAEL